MNDLERLEMERMVASRAPGLPKATRRALAEALVRQCCAACGRRFGTDDRETRKVCGEYRVFHPRCADAGALQIRAEVRTPQSMAARRRARAEIDALKRGKR